MVVLSQRDLKTWVMVWRYFTFDVLSSVGGIVMGVTPLFSAIDMTAAQVMCYGRRRY